MQGNPEKLLETLPKRQLNLRPRMVSPRPLRKWTWEPLKVYNGFTSAERIRGWQVSWWLRETGLLPFAKKCDLCGKDGAKYHGENYYDQTSMPALCKGHHFAIHKRFEQPRIWEKIVQKHHEKNPWLLYTGTEPMDLAGYLRDIHTPRLPYLMLNSPFLTIPDWIPKPSPDEFFPLFGTSARRKSPLKGPIRPLHPVAPKARERVRTW